MSPSLPVVLALSAGMSVLAWSLRSLTRGGAVSAFAVGVCILSGLGWWGGAILLGFFVGSSAVSRRDDPATQRFDAKGSRRDAGQVLANGGVSALLALAASLHLVSLRVGLFALTSSLAVAAADTWSSSLGPRSTRFPRDIWSRQPVPAGTSGAVSWLGTTAGLVGAVSVAALGAMAVGDFVLLPAAAGIGMLGMVLDSFIGSRFQARYHCRSCGTACEQSVHRCGAPSELTGGIRCVNNDGVNALATLFGGLSGMMAGGFLIH